MRESQYFSHDSNARSDPKIQALMSKYGFRGYGWYWAIIETLRDQPGYKYPVRSQYVGNALAMLMQCDKSEADEFISDCVHEFADEGGGLLCRDDSYMWSESLLRRMMVLEDKRKQRADKAQKAAMARYAAHAQQEQCSSNANAQQEQCKTMPSKSKSKSNNNILNAYDESHQGHEDTTKQASEYPDGFISFWTIYPKKADKGAALKAWKARIKAGAKSSAIITGAEKYAASVAEVDQKYIKNPATFLNSLAYENEYDAPRREADNGGYADWTGTGRDWEPADRFE